MTSTTDDQFRKADWSTAIRRAALVAPIAKGTTKWLLGALSACILATPLFNGNAVWAWSTIVIFLAIFGCTLVRHSTTKAPCVFDLRTCWQWLRHQRPLEPQTALAQAVGKTYLFVLALVTWFLSIGLESDFEAARSQATNSDQLGRAIGNLLQAVAAALLFAAATVPPVWIWRLVRRGQADKTIAAVGVKLSDVVATWVILWAWFALVASLVAR